MVERPLLNPETDMDLPQTAWIVFSNDTDISFLKMLRHGFRHCFIIMQQDKRWMLIDPRANKTDIHLLPHPHHFNFPRYFMQQGKTVVKIPLIKTPHKILWPWPMSCVETVKRCIGLHAFWILTPHQLYKHFQKLQQKGLK